MKKILIIALIVCCGAVLALPGRAARADDKVITLGFEDIAARVAAYNSTARIGKISLSEAQNALSQAQAANRDRREQRASVKEAIGETQQNIDSGLLDDVQLKEAQNLLATLNQVSNSLSNQSTFQLERTIEAVTLQNTQSLGQLVNGARQLFIRIHQSRLNLALQQGKLEQAQAAAGKAEIRLNHGLGTAAALAEAKLQARSAQAELAAQENQLQNMLAQMRTYGGYKPGEALELGEAPQLDPAPLAGIGLEEDAAKALEANFTLKLLQIDRVNANSSTAKRKIDIQIEQQKAAVRLAVEQKYALLLETQSKLDLAAAELAQAKQQLLSAETNFKLGKIAKNTLEKQQATVAAKQTAWQNATLALIAELADYQAKIDGLN